MKGQGRGLLVLLWIILIQCRDARSNYAEILWGQCHAFCITRYQSRIKQTLGPGDLSLTLDSPIRDCRRSRQCKWCLFACERPQRDYDDHGDCLSDCQNSRTRRNKEGREACREGCHFLAKSTKSKHGTCPPPAALSLLRSSCIQECQTDKTCSGMSKCCRTNCGQICHRPDHHDNVFPAMPRDLRFKKRRDGGLLVEWSREEEKHIVSPVIYILRWWCPNRSGVRYSITTKQRVRLSGYPDGVHPAVRCNYMVASINIKGSLGFTPPTSFMKKFLQPSPPLNLERRKRKLHDGKVDVTVRWEPPEYTDGLPVDRYLVSWSDGLPRAGTDYKRLHMHRKTIKSGRTSYSIPSLERGIMYFVQVRAIVDWHGKLIRGEPASTYIESFTAPMPADEEDVSSFRPRMFSASHVFGIMVDEPVFAASDLTARASWSLFPGTETAVEKYVLYWTLDVCDGEARHRKTPSRLTQEASTQKKEFHLSGLESSCIYEVKIHTVNDLGKLGEGQKIYFRTPPCHETKGRTPDIHCQSEVSPPRPPESLEVGFRPSCVCPAVVSWQRPGDETGDGAARTRAEIFSVKWGHSLSPSAAALNGGSLAVVYNAEPHSVHISGNESQACMRHLEPGKHYTVQVVAKAKGQQSPPAVKHFTAPVDFAPCYAVEPDEDAQYDEEMEQRHALAKQTEEDGAENSGEISQATSYGRNFAASLSSPSHTVIAFLLGSIVCFLSYAVK